MAHLADPAPAATYSAFERDFWLTWAAIGEEAEATAENDRIADANAAGK